MKLLALLPLILLAGCESAANYDYLHSGSWVAFVNQHVYRASSFERVKRRAFEDCHGPCVITFDRNDDRVGTIQIGK
jgi:hypothetical protein